MVNDFIEKNYKEIMKMAKSIIKNMDYEEVAHEVILQFLTYKKSTQLIQKGEAMRYISGMIHLSYYSTTSPYHKKYRKNTIEYNEVYSILYPGEDTNDVDLEKDYLLDAIDEIMKQKQDDLKIWYNLTLLKLYSCNSNYSKLSRETKIPRNAITQGVQEGIDYVKERIKRNKRI
jgi:hypothetical protein